MRTLLFLLTLFIANFATAQVMAVPPPDKPAAGDTTIYSFAEIQPKFPHGDSSFVNFVQQTIIYPDNALALGLEGTVYVSFVVEKNGSLSNVNVRRSVHSLLDKEALRVVNLSPYWLPGTISGQPVRVQLIVPVRFKIPPLKGTEQNATDTSVNVNLSSFTDTTIYTTADSMPAYPGGEKAWKQYLNDSMRYPQMEKEFDIDGKVLVSFIVEKDGRVNHVLILKSVSTGLDKEALRIVRASKPWKPGMVNGQPVRVSMTTEINFRLK
jgi:TonB family protein